MRYRTYEKVGWGGYSSTCGGYQTDYAHMAGIRPQRYTASYAAHDLRMPGYSRARGIERYFKAQNSAPRGAWISAAYRQKEAQRAEYRLKSAKRVYKWSHVSRPVKSDAVMTPRSGRVSKDWNLEGEMQKHPERGAILLNKKELVKILLKVLKALQEDKEVWKLENGTWRCEKRGLGDRGSARGDKEGRKLRSVVSDRRRGVVKPAGVAGFRLRATDVTACRYLECELMELVFG